MAAKKYMTSYYVLYACFAIIILTFAVFFGYGYDNMEGDYNAPVCTEGLMWLMYAGTGKECYKLTAERSEELMETCFTDYVDELHHDVGFMWHILSGANYRLTGNKRSRNRNLLAAMI